MRRAIRTFCFSTLYFSRNRVFLGCFICAVEIILRLLGYHASRTSLYFDMRFSKDRNHPRPKTFLNGVWRLGFNAENVQRLCKERIFHGLTSASNRGVVLQWLCSTGDSLVAGRNAEPRLKARLHDAKCRKPGWGTRVSLSVSN